MKLNDRSADDVETDRRLARSCAVIFLGDRDQLASVEAGAVLGIFVLMPMPALPPSVPGS